MIDLFHILVEMYNSEWLLDVVSTIRRSGLNYVNEMVKHGNYKFVREIAIGKLGY